MTPTLRLGSTGIDVQTLQRFLVQHGFYSGAIDGAFGARTAAAVEAFQASAGLAADGVVGAFTWAKARLATDQHAEPLDAIARLDPSLRPYARAFLTDESIGVPLVVTQGFRSSAAQAALYAQGRTTPGAIVTKAPAGSSWHEFGLAFDVAILKAGRATWPNDLALWERIGLLGESHDLEWGGRWKTIVDRPHFQRPCGLTLAQARAGRRPTTPITDSQKDV